MCVMCEGKRVCVCVNHLQANSSVITIPPCVCVCMCVHIYMCVCVCVCVSVSCTVHANREECHCSVV